MYNLQNYTIHRQDRNAYGGGVALYVSNTTTHERLDIGTIAAESVWIAADSSRGKIAVASIYRPPRADVHQFSEELEICIKAVRKNYEHILLLGNFNATHSSWLPTDKTDSMGEPLHCLLSILNLQQHTNFSTHIHRQLPSACLDLVISNISFKNHNNRRTNAKDEPDQRREEDKKDCNCRYKQDCPLDGNCLTESVVYQAVVQNNWSDNTKTYIGVTEGTFKQRFYGHTSSFKHEKQEKSTGLSKYIWQRKRANEKIPSNGPSYGLKL